MSNIEIYNTECLAKLRELPDNSIDLLLCDPPYGTTCLEFDKIKIDWSAWWTEVNRVCKPSAVQICFAAQPFATDLINANRRHFRYDMIWAKTNAVGFLSANCRPLRAHELILVFCQKYGRLRGAAAMQSVYNPQFSEGKPYLHKARKRAPKHYNSGANDSTYQNEGRRYPTSVLTYGRDPQSLHPTQKPLEMCRFLVRMFSNPGQRVLDTFMGGGSTGVACVLENRAFVGMELDPNYFAVAEKRLAEVRGNHE